MTQPSTLPIRTLIWLSLIGAVFMYSGVAFFIASGADRPSASSLPVWLLPLAAALTAAVAIVMHLRAGEAAPTRSDAPTGAPTGRRAPSALRPTDIPVWALDEAIAIYGLVAVFLGGTLGTYVIYGVASLILLVLHRPRA